MPTNLENSTVATRLEEVSFHSNPKEGHATVITEFWGESDWRQITFYFAMNSVWKGIKLVIVLKMSYFAYRANTLSKSTCVCRFLQYCRKVLTDFFKCLCIWSIWLQIIQVLYNIAGVWLSCWVTMSWKKYPVEPPIFPSTNWPEYQSQIKQILGKMNKCWQCQEKEKYESGPVIIAFFGGSSNICLTRIKSSASSLSIYLGCWGWAPRTETLPLHPPFRSSYTPRKKIPSEFQRHKSQVWGFCANVGREGGMWEATSEIKTNSCGS